MNPETSTAAAVVRMRTTVPTDLAKECQWCHETVSGRTIQSHFSKECPAAPRLSKTKKICSVCQQVRSMTSFHRHKKRKSGLSNTCKNCARQRMRLWNKSKPKKPDGRKPLIRPSRWIMKPCTWCGDMFNVKQMLKHIPRCASNPNRRHPQINYTPMEHMKDIRDEHLSGAKRRRKNNYLKSIYGVGIDVYERLMEKQGGLCAICRRPPEGTNSRTKSLHLDHSHATGNIRGLLCHQCNLGLGALRDDTAILDAAKAYLLSYRGVTAR